MFFLVIKRARQQGNRGSKRVAFRRCGRLGNLKFDASGCPALGHHSRFRDWDIGNECFLDAVQNGGHFEQGRGASIRGAFGQIWGLKLGAFSVKMTKSGNSCRPEAGGATKRGRFLGDQKGASAGPSGARRGLSKIV